jgi:MAF protein
MPLHPTASNKSTDTPPLILASTSPFRKKLLKKLHLSFEQLAPDINESPLKNESPQSMVARLSKAKAQAIAQQRPNSIIIASDQCAVFQNTPIGKPHTTDNAIKQLQQFSQQTITFYTGLCVINTATQQTFESMDITQVHFRKLSLEVIEHYITIEQPLNCAGSFKSEGLGITLFEKINSNDPNALIGLPLIELTNIFYQMGYALPLKPIT